MDPTDRLGPDLGEPRALTPKLRARLEEALLGRAGKEPPGAEPLAGIDEPRAVPVGARARIERALATEAGALLRGTDAARPLPHASRARLERALAPRRAPVRARAPRVLLAAAAALALVAGSTVVLTRTGAGRRVRPPLAAPARTPAPAPTEAPAAGSGGVAGAAPARPRTPPAEVAQAAAGFAALGPGPSTPPPPYAEGSAPPQAQPDAAAAGEPAAAPRETTPPAGASLTVAVVEGDPAQVAGFRAYVRLLNSSGGAGGHRLEIVTVSPRAAAPSRAVATVNLSPSPIAPRGRAPSWARAPVLETLAVPDDALRGDVFDIASAPERQGHLVADAMFPGSSPAARAAIYAAPGDVYGRRVPDAIAEVLTARGVTATRVVYSGGDVILVPADVSFLSMDTATARSWLRATRGDPRAGKVAGVVSLADESLLPDLPEGARALSPYALPRGTEAAALRDGARRPLSAAAVHGWVTAKALAVAIWRSDADSAAEVRRALEALDGYETGFAPYRVRPGTHSRSPEGLVLAVEGGAFVARTGFLADPF